MPEYQVLARKYRPKFFRDVLGQDPIIKTLRNAIAHQRTAHAYLFAGSRGIGKTTLARLFARALNCHSPQVDLEPCDLCSSCREIAQGNSLDVLEIDGASHRGIEDIRRINETIGYSPAGRYKIYIIDEVHMLTKEAFNALLKTLEEPPKKVKFLFATTEPHKIPSTILSRCQRFHLQRIPLEKIEEKLNAIAIDLSLSAQSEALRLIAQFSEGSLRDAESLFDQVISYQDQKITLDTVSEALGIFPREKLFAFDAAARQGDFSQAFALAEQVFSSGKNLSYFLEELIRHFRTLLLLKLGKVSDEKEIYRNSLECYTLSQCFEILDLLAEAEAQMKSAPSQRIALEMLLLRILRTYRKVPLDELVGRLEALELRLPKDTLSLKEMPAPKPLEVKESAPPKSPEEEKLDKIKKQSRQDTLMRFAAKELEGSIEVIKKDT